ncbi:MAG: PBP1A family penicillin-binding protein, partial [Oscillospiraceae bacterium]|nr:PBP1A family penicillin-binding protein [Oscillospiraceae bacterium]
SLPSQEGKTKDTERKERHILKSILKVIGSIFLVIIVTGAILACFSAAYIQRCILPKAEIALEDYPMDLTSVIYVKDAETGEYVQLQQLYGEENRTWVNYEEIPKNLEYAAVAIEDKRFYDHNGVDWYRTVGAFFNMFLGMRDTFGGSTITQQLVKNLTDEKDATVQRKVLEIFRAVELEKNYSKEKIMEWYLNYIYLGEGCYGVYSASYAYFDKHVSELSLAECACLIGITNNPSQYDPYLNEEKNKERQKIILQAMYEQEYITEEEYKEALEEKLVFKRADDEKTNTIFSYYVDQVINELISDLMEEKGISKAAAAKLVYSGGYQIYCNMDTRIQNIVDAVYNDTSNLPYKSASGQQLQSAITIIDPHTGYVMAVSGGMGEKTTSRGWSRATDSLRPPGSSIKPLSVYAPALELGLITPYSTVDDSPFKLINGKAWPVNVDHTYTGMTTIYDAVRVSKNTIAVKVLDMITPRYSYEFMTNKLHFSSLVEFQTNSNGRTFSDIDYAPLGLGGLTKGVSTLEMAAGYCMFANGGTYMRPTTYSKVLDSKGNVVLDHTPDGEKVISKGTAYYMNQMLEGVVRSGSGTAAKFSGMTIAGKTGTTTSKKDTWFIGYTPYYVGAVWVGYDQQERINLSANQAPVMWRKVMSQVHEGLPNKDFEETKIDVDENEEEGTVTVSYCLDSGKLATRACRADPRGHRVATGTFVKGDEPTETCDVHTYVKVCTAGSGYHLAGKYCPSSTVRTISLLKLDREIAASTVDTRYSYDYVVSRGRCKVHTSYAKATQKPKPTKTPEPQETEAPTPEATQEQPSTEPQTTPAPPTATSAIDDAA